MEKHIMQPHSDVHGNVNVAANNISLSIYQLKLFSDLVFMFPENRTGSHTFAKYLAITTVQHA